MIARNTAFTYKGKPLDAKMIGGELNVRYVLEGSVQRGGNRMRVNVQLIAAETGNHLWAERFDKPLADLFDMQDEIVARLAGALDAQLVAAEARRAEQGPTPDSMDLYFQGMAWFNKGLNPDNLTQASSFFDRALAVDPGNVDALIGSARVDVGARASVFVTNSAAAFFAAEAKASRVLSLVTDHARGHMVLGVVYIYTKRAARGIAECEHALALDRNLAQAHTISGWVRFLSAVWKKQKLTLSRRRLSPRDTMAYSWMSYAGIAKNYLGLYDQAIPWFRRAIETNRNASHPHFVWESRSRYWVDWTRRVPQPRLVSRSTRPSPSRAGARLVGDERRSDASRPVGAPSRRHAQGRRPRIIIVVRRCAVTAA